MKSKLLIIIVAVLLLAGGGGAYYFLVLGKKESAEVKKKDHHQEEEGGGDEAHASLDPQADAANKKADEEGEEEAAEEHGGGHGENNGPRIDPFVVNLADPGSRRYLRMNLSIALKKPAEDEPLLQARMPQLRDAVLLLLSSKTAAQLQGPEGKTALRQELIEQVNQVLTKKKKVVKNLYFTEFLIQ